MCPIMQIICYQSDYIDCGVFMIMFEKLEAKLNMGWAMSQGIGVSALPNFRDSPVFTPTSFNAERPNSTW